MLFQIWENYKLSEEVNRSLSQHYKAIEVGLNLGHLALGHVFPAPQGINYTQQRGLEPWPL